jgi:hypothetical protein
MFVPLNQVRGGPRGVENRSGASIVTVGKGTMGEYHFRELSGAHGRRARRLGSPHANWTGLTPCVLEQAVGVVNLRRKFSACGSAAE